MGKEFFNSRNPNLTLAVKKLVFRMNRLADATIDFSEEERQSFLLSVFYKLEDRLLERQIFANKQKFYSFLANNGYYPVVDFGSTNKDGSVNLFLPIETRTLSTKSQEVLHKVFGEFFDDVRISNGDFVYGLIEDDANHNFGFYNHYPCVNLAALRKQALESDENHLEAVAIHEVAHKILYSKFDPSQLRSEKDPELGKWLMSLSEIISFAVGLELDFKHIRSLISAADQPEHYYSIAVNVLKSAIKQADPDYFGKRRAFCSFHLGLFLDELKKIFQAQDFIRNYFMATAKSVLKSLVPSSLS